MNRIKYNKIVDLVNEDIKMVEDVIEKMDFEQAMIAIKKIWKLHQPEVIANKTDVLVRCTECTEVYNEWISWPCHDVEAIWGENEQG